MAPSLSAAVLSVCSRSRLALMPAREEYFCAHGALLRTRVGVQLDDDKGDELCDTRYGLVDWKAGFIDFVWKLASLRFSSINLRIRVSNWIETEPDEEENLLS